jgi:ethanolamine utilization protein EutN
MLIGKVIGTATSTVKHASMEACKLLIVQPMMADGRSTDGEPMVAVDHLGAGIGQRVVLTSDGAAIREMLRAAASPVRWSVAGIADE